jgi:hypothetical protein
MSKFWLLIGICGAFSLLADSEPMNKRSQPGLGLKFQLWDYNQSAIANSKQLWLVFRGTYQLSLSETFVWNTEAEAGALSLSHSGTSYTFRPVRGTSGLTYTGWQKGAEGVFPSLNYQYLTLLSKDNFGFRNLHGPLLGLNFRFEKTENEEIDVEQSIGLLITDSALSLGNSELALKIKYRKKGLSGLAPEWGLELGASRLSLSFTGGEVGAYIYQIGFFLSF